MRRILPSSWAGAGHGAETLESEHPHLTALVTCFVTWALFVLVFSPLEKWIKNAHFASLFSKLNYIMYT